MTETSVDCLVCGRPLRGDEAAVGQGGRGIGDWAWIEFVEDLRTSGLGLIHPKCFAEAHGVDRLVEVVHERDLRDRGVVWKLVTELRSLRSRLPDEEAG